MTQIWMLLTITPVLLIVGCCDSQKPMVEHGASIDAATVNDASIRTEVRFDLLSDLPPYSSGATRQHYTILESLGGGVGVIDLEADGIPDLICPGGGDLPALEPRAAGDSVMRLVDGRFGSVSSSLTGVESDLYSHGVGVGDLDNDGFDDFAITGFGRPTLFRNNGDGTFHRSTPDMEDRSAHWSTSCTLADLNRDGFCDIYVCQYVDWSPENDPTCSNVIGQQDVCPPRSFNALPDLVFLNDVSGGFSPAVGTGFSQVKGKGLGVVAGDLDNDGSIEIYVANDTTENFLFTCGDKAAIEIGLSSGTALDDLANANGSMGVTFSDVDGDQQLDVFVSNYQDEMFAIYRNLGELSFTHASDRFRLSHLGSDYVGFGCVALDFELDGDEDLAIVNGHAVHHPPNGRVRQTALLLLNDKGQCFQRVTSEHNAFLAFKGRGRGLARLDWNGDGLQDMVCRGSDEPAYLVANQSKREGRSLVFRLIGTTSPRRSVGGSISLSFQTGRTLLRQQLGGGSYMSENEYGVHFGIPSGETVSNVLFRWDEGHSHTLSQSDLTIYNSSNPILMVVQPKKPEQSVRVYHFPR